MPALCYPVLHVHGSRGVGEMREAETERDDRDREREKEIESKHFDQDSRISHCCESNQISGPFYLRNERQVDNSEVTTHVSS